MIKKDTLNKLQYTLLVILYKLLATFSFLSVYKLMIETIHNNNNKNIFTNK